MFDGPFSQFFGISVDGNSRNPESFYQTEGIVFAVGNNKILNNLTDEGFIEKGYIIEMKDSSEYYPEKVGEMIEVYNKWSGKVNAIK